MSDLQTQLDEADDLIELPTEALPLDAWHRAQGGRMVDFAGYWMPVQFRGIMEEHLWTRSKAGLFDVSHMGQLEISGENVAAALEAVLPGDIAVLAPGRMRYSYLLDEDGGILDDLMVTNRGDLFYVVVNGAMKWDDIAHLCEALPDDVTLTHLDEQGLLALQGPEAAGVLARLGLKPVQSDTPAVEALTFMQAGLYDWQGRTLGISRSGYTGEDGYEISVAGQDIEALANALCADDAVMPVGLGARDSLRLEAGLPLYGHDLTPETGPVEAGLMFAIAKRRRAEGGFPGADRILGELAAGPARKRVGLLVEGRLPAREGAPVLADGAQIGVVTSGGFSPTLERPIAMAYVDAAHAAPGTALEIEVRGRKLAASVTAMPFVPHKYHRQGA